MIYFDNNATTCPSPAVVDAMIPFLAVRYANPSSSYEFARVSRKAVESARESTAALLGAAHSDEIVFTSGGTESDNWAIRGALAARPEKRHVVTTKVEHEAVRTLCEHLEVSGYEVTWLGVDRKGAVDLDELRAALREDTAVVSMMLANNETGVIFPVKQAAAVVKENSDALFHSDGVNAAGKIRIDVESAMIDLFSISAHKFHGPKGIGALYIRRGTFLTPQSIGGRQEAGRRAGTEAVHQIAGLGTAAELASDLSPVESVKELRDRLENSLLEAIPLTSVNGSRDERLPNTSNISFENTNGERLLAALNDIGVCVSTGSACNESSRAVSPVLKAMDVPHSSSMGSIRFSLGRFNTLEEVDFVVSRFPDIVERVRSLSTGAA